MKNFSLSKVSETTRRRHLAQRPRAESFEIALLPENISIFRRPNIRGSLVVKKFVLPSGSETARRRRLANRPWAESLEARALMTASFEPVGMPTVGETVFGDGVSPDGSVVVGYDRPNGAFEWTQRHGLVLLKDGSGNIIDGNATGASENGQVIVGTAGGAGLDLPATAFRWTAASGAVSIVSSAYRGTANAVSADGTIIAGDYKATSNGYTSPYTLTNGSLDIVGVVNQNGVTTTEDNTISANGTVVAGSYSTDDSSGVYAWINGQFVTLNGDGISSGTAIGVSYDGSVVVGELGDDAALGAEVAFRWEPANGSNATILPLPSGFNDSTAAGVTSDGTSIVGWMAASSELMANTTSTAFIWDQTTNEIENLQDVLTTSDGLGSSLSGWTLTEATAITPDGNTIVGLGVYQGRLESWIVTNLNMPREAEGQAEGQAETWAEP